MKPRAGEDEQKVAKRREEVCARMIWEIRKIAPDISVRKLRDEFVFFMGEELEQEVLWVFSNIGFLKFLRDEEKTFTQKLATYESPRVRFVCTRIRGLGAENPEVTPQDYEVVKGVIAAAVNYDIHDLKGVASDLTADDIAAYDSRLAEFLIATINDATTADYGIELYKLLTSDPLILHKSEVADLNFDISRREKPSVCSEKLIRFLGDVAMRASQHNAATRQKVENWKRTGEAPQPEVEVQWHIQDENSSMASSAKLGARGEVAPVPATRTALNKKNIEALQKQLTQPDKSKS